MSDLAVSIVRTSASKIAGAIIGVLVSAGVVLPADLSADATAYLVAVIVVGAQLVYYPAARALERKWPGMGRLLLAPKQPHYAGQNTISIDPPYGTDEEIAARIVDELRHQRPRP